MPISAHLHRKFQETLGADAADEIVNIIEGMDAIRGDIGELRHEMQLGFARIDAQFDASEAKWAARFAASDAKWDARFAASDAKWDARFDARDAKWQARFDASDAKWEARFSASDAKLDARFDSSDARWAGRIDTTRSQMETLVERSLRDQTRFFFLAWSVLLAAIVGLYAR